MSRRRRKYRTIDNIFVGLFGLIFGNVIGVIFIDMFIGMKEYIDATIITIIIIIMDMAVAMQFCRYVKKICRL